MLKYAMTTISAEDLIKINTEAPEAELKRLELLHAQICQLPRLDKQRLVMELLQIIENRSEKIWPRIQACNVLGGRKQELELLQTKLLTQRIRKVIMREFYVVRRSGFLGLKAESTLRNMSSLEFCLLQSLVVTLLRVDFLFSKSIADGVIADLADSERKASLLKLMADEKAKNDFGDKL